MGGKLGDEMPREVSFFPPYEIDARHITSGPRCRHHPRSRRSGGGEEGEGQGKRTSRSNIPFAKV